MSVRGQWLSSSLSHLHDDERSSAPLNVRELTAMNRTRLFGATGTALMAIGALGAGARPVIQDPIFGVRLLNLPSRIQTVSLTMTTTGAVMMTLAWLMLGRFAIGSLRTKGVNGERGPSRRMSRGQLDRTLLLWILPLLIAPPMYSKDVYSYLAQSQIARLGKDPYTEGPSVALGLDHVFTLSVPSLWRETPAPYGPLFLWIGKGIAWFTGDDIVAGALCHRLVELLGVLLIIWATPRLAQRCGVAEVSALWLGAANPLLLMHLVAGIHNEALMLGLMLAGTELAMRGVDSARSLAGVRPRLNPLGPRTRAEWATWAPLGNLLAGTVLITASSQVKLPSLLALGFVGMALARRWGGGIRGLFQAGALLGAVTGAGMVLIAWASGLGFGWVYTLGTANAVRSWMSPPTLVALGTGQVGILLGLGDHTTAILSLTRGIGIGIIGIAVSWLLFAVLRGRLHPVGGLGVALGITVLLFPVVQPWYLLWAIIPLAAWATRPAFRGTAIGITLLVGIFGPTANGDRFALFQIIDATVASAIIALLLIAITHNYLPWRRLPNGDDDAPLTLTDRDTTREDGRSDQPHSVDQDGTTGADAVGDEAVRDDNSAAQPRP
ncbi:polyprenol phosphomannose-dependent alpha 1,6 mannosyltransferase MptB [Mycobacterium sp. NPDC050853]|uniref:polyprenol phosphomannose-dependent alpha 1,6 mannosyltransferase MptB n=1 Tax=Mycobacterium sp. NPDC050853 TaxID=3155160 RepID=UPI0033C5C236